MLPDREGLTIAAEFKVPSRHKQKVPGKNGDFLFWFSKVLVFPQSLKVFHKLSTGCQINPNKNMYKKSEYRTKLYKIYNITQRAKSKTQNDNPKRKMGRYLTKIDTFSSMAIQN